MIDKLEELQQKGLAEIAAADTPDALEEVRVACLGRKSA